MTPRNNIINTTINTITTIINTTRTYDNKTPRSELFPGSAPRQTQVASGLDNQRGIAGFAALTCGGLLRRSPPRPVVRRSQRGTAR